MIRQIDRRWILAAIATAVILIAPWVFGPFAVTLLNYIGIYALAALGLVLLTGSGGLTSFGQAAFFGVGAYATAYLSVVLGWSPWLGLIAALALTFVVAYLLGYLTLHLGGHYLPITTIAWGVAIYLLFGTFEVLGRYGGMTHIPSINFFGISLEAPNRVYYLIWATVGLAMLGAYNLIGSRQGRAIRALRGGTVMVESLGIDSFRIKLALFVISALLSALAGWLYAHMQHFISPATFDLRTGIEFLLMAVLGGSGYIGGALVGAATVTIVKNWLQDLLPLLTSSKGNLEIIVFGVLFILLLQYSPRGMMPIILSAGAALGVNKWLRPPQAARVAEPFVASDLMQREMPRSGTILLSVKSLTRRFGGLVAVDQVSFDIQAGTIFALIGPNGAGKSTTFNLITGVLPLSDGAVSFNGKDITGATQRAVASHGVARTFQHVKLRPKMTLVENVMLGAYPLTRTGYAAGMLSLGSADETRVRALALAKLAEVGLADRPWEAAGNLPLGQQRLLEIARALAADPVFIMLDEPAAGLRSQEKQALAQLLRNLRGRGMTIMLVEHDMEFLMSLADQVVVVNFGRKIAEGTPAEIRASKDVQNAYLGGSA